MRNTIIFIIGLLVLFFSLIVRYHLITSENKALKLDQKKTTFGMIEGPLPCNWEAKLPQRLMSENKSQAILIDVINNLDMQCALTLTFRAPGFDISPSKEEQTITLQPQKNGSLSWILSPRKPGTYETTVSDSLNTKIFGITVTDTYGLSPNQAKIFSILGSLFGPMFTIPWWWEKLKSRKQSKGSA